MYYIPNEFSEYKLTKLKLVGFLFFLPFSLLGLFFKKYITKIISFVVILSVMFSIQNANAAAVELFSMSLYNDANLQAYYRLEDLTDSEDSGTDYDLVNTNSVAFNAAQFTNGADFGASDGDKNLATSSDLGIGGYDDAITISLWVKLNTEITTGKYEFLNKTLGPNTNVIGYSVVYEYNAGTPRVGFWRERHGVVGYLDYYNVTLGTSGWYHLVLTFDPAVSSGTMKGYINAVERTTRASCAGNGANDANLVTKLAIGASWSGYSTGTANNALAIIDDVAIFNRALTATEISDIYNGVADTARGEEYLSID